MTLCAKQSPKVMLCLQSVHCLVYTAQAQIIVLCKYEPTNLFQTPSRVTVTHSRSQYGVSNSSTLSNGAIAHPTSSIGSLLIYHCKRTQMNPHGSEPYAHLQQSQSTT